MRKVTKREKGNISELGIRAALVVDDDPAMRKLLAGILEDDGWTIQTADNGKSALARLSENDFDVVLSDLKMPEMDGMELLKNLRMKRPDLPVVVLTAYGSVTGAVEAMKIGAFDFLTKPLPEPESLRKVMRDAWLSSRDDKGEQESTRTSPQITEPVGREPVFLEVLEMARAVAPRATSVLIVGESGTGKEVLARYIHSRSKRSRGPFVAINCAAIPENLLESQLFGHEKGAFTGAVHSHDGYFRQAHGGTLLLDEIGELAIPLQSKLLRVIESNRLTPVGSEKQIEVDVRIIASTNKDLEKAVKSGEFRSDLFFRINVFPIRLPPLRERPGDIILLANHFLRILARSPDRTHPGIGAEVEQVLLSRDWPGNVRELQNVLERAYILSRGGEIKPRHLGHSVLSGNQVESAGKGKGDISGSYERGDDVKGAEATGEGSRGEVVTVGKVRDGEEDGGGTALNLKELERRAIIKAINEEGGNRKRAAKRLGIALRTLQYKIKQYDLPNQQKDD